MRTILITGNTYPLRRALRTVGAYWSPALEGWVISAEAEPSVRALTDPAGLTVTLLEEGHEALAPVSYADRRAAKAERHGRRAERLEARADSRERRRGETQAALNANPMYSDYSAFTEPIKAGHHSEGRHRRAKAAVSAKMDKVVTLWREEAELRGRATAALAAAKPDSERSAAFMVRRIEELGAELRKIERTIAGHHTSGLEAVPVDLSTEWGQRLAAKRDELTEGVAYWEALLAGHGGVPHSKATIKAGDTITGQWVGGRARVERTNAKTVSIILLDHPLVGWKAKVPYAEIVGVEGEEG